MTAKMRPTFSSEKNSAGDVTPALTRANRPSLPDCRAPREQLLQLGRRGASVANWQVNSYIGRTCSSRALILAASPRRRCAPGERVVERGGAQLGVAEGVVDALRGDEVLVVAGVADQRPAGAEGLAEVVRHRRADEALLALGRAHAVGEGRRELEHLEVVAFDVLPCWPRTRASASRR